MIKKYIILILLTLAFLMLPSFAQEVKTTYEEACLSKGMTVNEIKQLLGEPTSTIGQGRNIRLRYLFADEKYLWLRFNDDKLFAAFDKDDFDLFSTYYTAKVVKHPVFIDNEEIPTYHQQLNINGNIYLLAIELPEIIGIKVNWNNSEKNLLKITKNEPFVPELGFMEIIKPVVGDTPNLVSVFRVPVTREEKNKGIAQVKEAAAKLRKGLTKTEVEQLIGKPTQHIGSGVDATLYEFSGNETLVLVHHNGLESAHSKRGFQFLEKYPEEYTVRVVDFPVLIADKEADFSNHVVTTDKSFVYTDTTNIYIPIENLAEQLGIKVIFNEEKQQLEITTK